MINAFPGSLVDSRRTGMKTAIFVILTAKNLVLSRSYSCFVTAHVLAAFRKLFRMREITLEAQRNFAPQALLV
jgi:hypothetical protein